MNFFYARVSTAEQNLGRQLEEAKQHKFDKVYIDKLSGKDTNRPELQKMMDTVRMGDTVTVLSYDRIARNVRDLLELVDTMTEKGVTFKSLKEGFDTTTDTGRFILTVLGGAAELERANILERQRQGIALAKQLGKYQGRRPRPLPDLEKVYHQWCDGSISMEQAGKLLGVSRATFYRRIKQYESNKIIDFGNNIA